MPPPVYTHSRVFASLKDVREKIQENLTTSQYLQILDDLLDRSIYPIIGSTNFMDSAVARLIGWQERNFRRKISFLDRTVAIPKAVTFLLQNDRTEKIAAFQAIKLERGVRVSLVKTFHSSLQEYELACNAELVNPKTKAVDLSYCLGVKNSLEQHFGADRTMIAALNESRFWLGKALDFKQLIMEKFIRLTLNTAQKDYKLFFNLRVNLDDIIQTYMLAASRAIDKCDSAQGALTSHIQNWFLTARSRVQERLQSNEISKSIDTIDFQSEEFKALEYTTSNIEQDIVNSERLDVISRLARLADPVGAARLYLGIEERLDEQERARVGAKRPTPVMVLTKAIKPKPSTAETEQPTGKDSTK